MSSRAGCGRLLGVGVIVGRRTILGVLGGVWLCEAASLPLGTSLC